MYVCMWAHIKTIYGKICHKFKKNKERYVRSIKERKEEEEMM